MIHPTPCLECGQPSKEQIAEAAHLLRRQTQFFGDLVGRPAEPALQQFISWLIEIEQAAGTSA